MRVNDVKRPAGGGDSAVAPRPTSMAQSVSDDFPVLHCEHPIRARPAFLGPMKIGVHDVSKTTPVSSTSARSTWDTGDDPTSEVGGPRADCLIESRQFSLARSLLDTGATPCDLQRRADLAKMKVIKGNFRRRARCFFQAEERHPPVAANPNFELGVQNDASFNSRRPSEQP